MNGGTETVSPQNIDPHPVSPRPSPHLEPGWLHTYATRKDLKLIYVDGQSAAKTSKGTLDSQDYILLRNDFNSSNDPRSDLKRAAGLCNLVRNRWKSIDGFLRMKHGFEILLCDFASLESVKVARVKKHWGLDDAEFAAGQLPFSRAIGTRYNGIGGDRVRLNYDSFVSAYGYNQLDLFDSQSLLPRLTNISDSVADRIFADIDKMVLQDDGSEQALISLNWQAIADQIVERYSRRLTYLVSGAFWNMRLLKAEVERILTPFIDYDNRDTEAEVEACTMNFIPRCLDEINIKSLAARAVSSVSHTICSELFKTTENETYEEAVLRIHNLIDYLAWPVWKACNPNCGVDEVCFTAIWPFGSSEDHYNPACRNGTGILMSRGYWEEAWRRQ